MLLALSTVSATLNGKDLPKAAAGGTNLSEVVTHRPKFVVGKVPVLLSTGPLLALIIRY